VGIFVIYLNKFFDKTMNPLQEYQNNRPGVWRRGILNIKEKIRSAKPIAYLGMKIAGITLATREVFIGAGALSGFAALRGRRGLLNGLVMLIGTANRGLAIAENLGQEMALKAVALAVAGMAAGGILGARAEAFVRSKVANTAFAAIAAIGVGAATGGGIGIVIRALAEPELIALTESIFLSVFVLQGILALMEEEVGTLEAVEEDAQAQREQEKSAEIAFGRAIIKNHIRGLKGQELSERIEAFKSPLPEDIETFSRLVIEQIITCRDLPTTENTPSFLHAKIENLQDLQRRLKRNPIAQFSLLSHPSSNTPEGQFMQEGREVINWLLINQAIRLTELIANSGENL
jgi:hypothetical protein